MNMREVMRGMWMISGIREKLIKAWVSAKDLQGVNFTDPASLNQLAQKIMPNLLKNNPQIAQQIKESGRLDWETKKEVVNIVDNL